MSYARLIDRVGELLRVRTIVQTGSLNRASHALCLSQPALTRRVRELEADLQIDLLVRSNRGVVATPAFERLAAKLDIIHDQLRELQHELDVIARDGLSLIRCGASSLAVNQILPAVLGDLRGMKSLTIEVVEGALDDLVAQLQMQDIDVVIGPSMARPLPPELRSELLREYEISAFAGPKLAEHLADSETLAPLAEEQWVMPPRGSKAFADVASVFASQNVPLPRRIIYANTLGLLAEALRKQSAVAFAPLPLLAEEVASGRLVRLPTPRKPLQGDVTVYWRKSTPRSPAMAAFLRAVRSTVQRGTLDAQ